MRPNIVKKILFIHPKHDFLIDNNQITLISLINVEVGINVEGVQKFPNH